MAYTKQNARVKQFNVTTDFDSGDTPLTVNCQAYLENRLTENADTVLRGIPAINFNLLDPAISGTSITAATKTVTYQQLAALIRQACLDRANAAGVS